MMCRERITIYLGNHIQRLNVLCCKERIIFRSQACQCIKKQLGFKQLMQIQIWCSSPSLPTFRILLLFPKRLKSKPHIQGATTHRQEPHQDINAKIFSIKWQATRLYINNAELFSYSLIIFRYTSDKYHTEWKKVNPLQTAYVLPNVILVVYFQRN